MALSDRWQIQDLKQRVPLAELIGRDILLKRRGNRLVACCPFHSERTPSFGISQNGQFYKCFGCGASGDQFGWLIAYRQLDFIAAKAELMRLAGIDQAEWERADPAELQRQQREREAQQLEAEEREVSRKIAFARTIWDQAQPIEGTLAEVYLRSRGIDMAKIGHVPSLRFHPALEHRDLTGLYPAMVGYIQAADRSFAGVHRTYLAADGSGKLEALDAEADEVSTKLMLGRAWQGAIRFARPAPVMAIGEGIETCLSVRINKPDLNIWAAMSLGNIAGAGLGRGEPHPYKPDCCLPSTVPDMGKPGVILPPDVRKIIILADHDNKDQAMAMAIMTRAANRWRNEGREVFMALPPKGMDFNDWWQQCLAGGKVGA